MKRFLLSFILCTAMVGAPALLLNACAAPSTRVVQTKTLRVIGETAKASLDTASQMLKDHTMSLSDYMKVADFYDNRFQPVYRVVVSANASNLDSPASPEIAQLAQELGALVIQLQKK